MTNYTEKTTFSAENFENPPSVNSPIYSWIWNSPMTTETVEKEIDEMAVQGMRAFYIIPEPPEFRSPIRNSRSVGVCFSWLPPQI